jgi:hypothetical protein
MSKNNSMSPGETNYRTKSNLLWLKEMMPQMTFDKASDNLLSLQKGNLSAAKGLINEMVGSVPDNPMTNLFRSIFGGGDEGGGDPQAPVFAPEPEQPPVAEPPPPPKQPTASNGWGAVSNDQDAIYWALEKGDITRDEADWLLRWQNEAADGNNWVDGSGGTKNWDYMNSGLTSQNKGIVDKFYKSVSGNWGGGQQAPQQPQQQPQQQPPQAPGMGMPPQQQQGGPAINPNMNNLTPQQQQALLNMQKYAGGMGAQ